MITGTTIPNCEPFSESACDIAAKKLGRPIEKGNYQTKGCYYYKSGTHSHSVWFGTGGNLNERKDWPTLPDQLRPSGYDCKIGISNQV